MNTLLHLTLRRGVGTAYTLIYSRVEEPLEAFLLIFPNGAQAQAHLEASRSVRGKYLEVCWFVVVLIVSGVGFPLTN